MSHQKPTSRLLTTLLVSLTLLLSPSLALALPAPVPAEPSSPDVTKLFNGLGHIIVLNSTSYSDASLSSDSIGCLSDAGYVVTASSSSDCATFSTSITSYPKTISSKIGGCSFGNQAMPTNEDSRYGARQHAWSCNEDPAMVPEGERYYTIVSLSCLSSLSRKKKDGDANRVGDGCENNRTASNTPSSATAISTATTTSRGRRRPRKKTARGIRWSSGSMRGAASRWG